MSMGSRIREARKRAGMTQQELAQKLGISYVGVSQWERDIRNPKWVTVQKIAKALNVDPFSLYDEDPDDWGYTIGERLSTMIAYRKFTTADVSARTNIPAELIDRAIANDYYFTLEELRRIAVCLGTDIPSIRGEKRPPYMANVGDYPIRSESLSEVLSTSISYARYRAELTQEELAEMIGQPLQNVQQYESGDATPNLETLNAIAKALHVEPFELLGMQQTVPNVWESDNNWTYLEYLSHIREERLLRHFGMLNDLGQERAISSLSDLTEIPKYRKNNPSKED